MSDPRDVVLAFFAEAAAAGPARVGVPRRDLPWALAIAASLAPSAFASLDITIGIGGVDVREVLCTDRGRAVTTALDLDELLSDLSEQGLLVSRQITDDIAWSATREGAREGRRVAMRAQARQVLRRAARSRTPEETARQLAANRGAA